MKRSRLLVAEVKVGTLLLKRSNKQEFAVVNVFMRRKQRMFVLETWLPGKLQYGYRVEPTWKLRMEYMMKPRTRKTTKGVGAS